MRIRLATGFTLIELLIVVTLIGVIVAIAVPGLLRARMAGNEASAIASLRAIIDGQSAYSSSCAGGGYAVTLADLARPAPGATPGVRQPGPEDRSVGEERLHRRAVQGNRRRDDRLRRQRPATDPPPHRPRRTKRRRTR